MGLHLLKPIDLPDHLQPGGFDHAAVHPSCGRMYIAHTANNSLDVIDCVDDQYLGFDPARNKVFAFLPKTHRALVFEDRGKFAGMRGETDYNGYEFDYQSIDP